MLLESFSLVKFWILFVISVLFMMPVCSKKNFTFLPWMYTSIVCELCSCLLNLRLEKRYFQVSNLHFLFIGFVSGQAIRWDADYHFQMYLSFLPCFHVSSARLFCFSFWRVSDQPGIGIRILRIYGLSLFVMLRLAIFFMELQSNLGNTVLGILL